ncbi:hypothetical protein FisN_8Lh333 [Fistulifera solaris]|uniref:Uncharacterized protein n=1 Tax=Fistulifera solaris TaxID=1519565 RepID=A0A1Z5JMX9_FISSO|nr:hypothetical protein FisN_8Lh333 [Fistulifera solaris]|eukprot:GAX15373.1 hypothetical protein FisN_8Lh333 [Fistulifera solaris]
MEDLYRQLMHRNARETAPFIAIHESNASLLHQVDSLQEKWNRAEREVHSLRQQLRDNSNPATGSTNAAVAAALQNEKRIRDKLEKLQEEFNQKLKVDNEQKALALQTSRDLAELKDLHAAQEKTIVCFEEAKLQSDRLIEHLQNEVENATSNAKLAEQQFDGLKKTIRCLQEENDKLQKENRDYESRFVSDKEKMVHEMNLMSETMEKLKKENEMLRSYQVQEAKQSSWSLFGLGKLSSESKDAAKTAHEPPKNDTRKWGNFNVVVPTTPKHILSSHPGKEGTCVRYDTCGNDLVVTCGMDSTVKVWDAGTGALRATFHGSTSYPTLSCDVYDNLVAGASTDKTCRVWNVRTQRMLHHLVGHQHKVNCVRLNGSEKSVITASSDRSIKVWDINRTTYRQTTTLRHSSTTSCLDIPSDPNTLCSGHMDGAVRGWDLRSGSRCFDFTDLHGGGVTSIHLNRANSTEVVTNGLDSCLKLIDIRTGIPLQTFRHKDFVTSQSWSSGVVSPDGKLVAAASNESGALFIWNTNDGSLRAKLDDHQSGVCAIDWNQGGPSGQQVATMDRKGTLILWA